MRHFTVITFDMFDFMKPIWHTSLTKKDLIVKNTIFIRISFVHSSPPVISYLSFVLRDHFFLPLVASATFRAPYQRSSLQVRPIWGPRSFVSQSCWLFLGCYPGLNPTTSSTRSSLCSVLASCSLWLNIFSALKIETLCFSEKFSNGAIQRHVQENSALHSHLSEKVNFINPGQIPFRTVFLITISERCRSRAVDFLQSPAFAVPGNNFPTLVSGLLSRRCDSKWDPSKRLLVVEMLNIQRAKIMCLCHMIALHEILLEKAYFCVEKSTLAAGTKIESKIYFWFSVLEEQIGIRQPLIRQKDKVALVLNKLRNTQWRKMGERRDGSTILDIGIGRTWVVSFTFWQLYPWK